MMGSKVLACLAGLLLLGVAGCEAGPAPSGADAAAAPARPDPQKILDKRVSGAKFLGETTSGELLTVRYSLDTAWDEKAQTRRLFETAGATALMVQQGALAPAPEVTRVRIAAEVPGLDRLGNEIAIAMPPIDYELADLKAMKVENLMAADLARLVVNWKPGDPAGLRGVVAWCGEKENYARAQRLCLEMAGLL